MTTRAITEFNKFMRVAEASGRGISPTEAEKGLQILQQHGASKADVAAVQKWLDKHGAAISKDAREVLQFFVTTAKNSIYPGRMSQIRKEFLRFDKNGTINWSLQAPGTPLGTRLYSQTLVAPKGPRDATYNVIVVLSPAAPSAEARDPNSASQFWVQRWPAPVKGARQAAQYAGPFTVPPKDTWIPPPDWDPHPVALYAVIVDRAVRSGDSVFIANVLAGAERAQAKLAAARPATLAAMSFTASAAAPESAVSRELAKHINKLRASIA